MSEGNPTYTEALVEVRERLAILDERTMTTNERIEKIDRKLDDIAGLSERVAQVEAKQGILASLNAALTIIASTVTGWVSMRMHS